MRELDPRIVQLIKEQRRGATFITIGSAVVSTLMANSFFGGMTLVTFIVSFIIGYFLMQGGMFFLTMYLQNKFYQNDLEGFIRDVQDAVEHYSRKSDDPKTECTMKDVEEDMPGSFTVVILNKPEKPIGYFQDAPIYDWLDVRGDNDEVLHFEYEGVMNIKEGEPITLEPGRLLISPGIVYKLTEKAG